MFESLPEILLILLVLTCVCGLIFAGLYPQISGRSRSGQRMEHIAARSANSSNGSDRDKTRRLRHVGQRIKELEKESVRSPDSLRRPSFQVRLRQAGLAWSRATYAIICAGSGAITLTLGMGVLDLPLPVSAAFALCGAILFPHLFVVYHRRKRLKNFADEFANALDIIVRGVKAGLPLADCFRIISTEAAEPVRSEILTVVDDQSFGIPIDEAVQRLARRVPIAETNYLAVVLSVQARTGGSLSEALSNLSTVLRDRKRMAEKIKAMSSEAKASALIIGSLPVIVTAILFVISRDYILILFETLAGNMVLAGSAVWMLLGTLIMRKMINFDY